MNIHVSTRIYRASDGPGMRNAAYSILRFYSSQEKKLRSQQHVVIMVTVRFSWKAVKK